MFEGYGEVAIDNASLSAMGAHRDWNAMSLHSVNRRGGEDRRLSKQLFFHILSRT